MINRTVILSRLLVQEDVEGSSPYTALLRRFVGKIETELQWQAFVNVRHYKHGELSYQYHIFYDPKPELVSLLVE